MGINFKVTQERLKVLKAPAAEAEHNCCQEVSLDSAMTVHSHRESLEGLFGFPGCNM